MYIKQLYNELRDWYDIRKTAKANIKLLAENNVRVDYLGRMYTVINVPDTLMKDQPSRENFIYAEMRKIDDILIKMRVNELVFPSIEMIPDSTAYLLVLQGTTDYIQFWKIIGHSVLYTAYFFILKIIYRIISNNTTLIDTLINFIKSNV